MERQLEPPELIAFIRYLINCGLEDAQIADVLDQLSIPAVRKPL